ncbi:hypothetical protein LguiA_029372 [Lonicera macranthoides]
MEDNLPSFQKLSHHRCRLRGTIPNEIGMLSKLDISNNYLSGHLPFSLANLTSLEFLGIYNNSMNGSIPFVELGNLKNLSATYLHKNLFSGSIPSSVGFLTHIKELALSRNQITGSTPSELGNLKNLESLLLGWNSFSGPIPSSICVLTHLTALHLFGNQTHRIHSARNMKSEKSGIFEPCLELSGNQLTGFILSEIRNLKNLEYLNLSSNGFSCPLLLRFKYFRFFRFCISDEMNPVS